MTVASSTVNTSGCGSPTPSTLTVGATSASFSNITVADNGTCTISISVTAATDDTYPNTTQNLFLDTLDTGSKATATLAVSSLPTPPSSCGISTNTATWSLENYTASTSTNNGPLTYSTKAGDISATTTATYGAQGTSTSGIASTATGPTGWSLPSSSGVTGNSWGIRSGWLTANPATPTTATTPYFQFRVDGASNYGGIGLTLNYNLQGNWSNSANWYVLFSTDGTTWSNPGTAAWSKANSWQSLSASTATTGAATVYFRVYFAGAQNDTAVAYVDNVNVTGCARPVPPTLAKSFSPTTIGADTSATTANYSTLTFTIANPRATALTGVTFSDTLPTGLVVANPPTVSAISCTSPGTLTNATITATAGSNTITLAGANTLSASAAGCTFSVRVQGTVAGSYTNTTNAIKADYAGANTGGANVGYGSASLTVVAPPLIAKTFSLTNLLTGTSTNLNFTINNPNPSTTLSAVQFSDSLPLGLDVVSDSSSQCGGGTLTITNNASPTQDTIVLSGGSLAGGASCSFSVPVTGTTAGSYTNTTTVSSSNGGTGNTTTANILVRASNPGLNLLKQVGLSASGPWYTFVTLPTRAPKCLLQIHG